MSITKGLNHLGLAVRNLEETTAFFVDVLGWKEIARDDSYPRNAVTDGHLRLTLWQIDGSLNGADFDRRANVGLHHLALEIETCEALDDIAAKIAAQPGIKIEFMPEPMGDGPRRHMMFAEPGGLRIELTWPGP